MSSQSDEGDFSTLLSFSGAGIPPYSARGLKQTMAPIDESKQLRRTINGSLKDLSVDQFHKYKSTITGDDQQPPAASGMWPGNIIVVDCIVELAYETGEGSPERTVVATRTEGDFTFYRPQITFRIVDFNIDLDEWGAQIGWSLDLEEV